MASSGRLLIAGGMGYIGARLATTLTEYREVIVTGRTITPIRERWLAANAGRVRSAIFNSAQQRELPVAGDFDAVINLALSSAAAAARDPEGSHRAAMQTTTACLKLVTDGRARLLVHFSTFHVYGSQFRPVFDETDEPNPQHPYGRNHLACERLIASDVGADAAYILRATNITGAPMHADLGDQSKLLFLDLCRQAARAGSMALQNDGLSYRDFLAFPDLVSAIRLLLDTGAPTPATPMNLARGEATRLDVIARGIQMAAARVIGATPILRFGSGADAWRHPFAVNRGRLGQAGWRPATQLEDEIEPTVRFFRDNE